MALSMSRLPSLCRSAVARQPSRLLTHHHVRSIASNSRCFQISDEVRQALSDRRPVVALESTIYTHGFPYPDSLDLATRLENLVRMNGAVPATIGIVDGIARVGLTADHLIRLVSSPNPLKISRRDLGFAMGQTDPEGKRWNGGTTISGTMVLAHLAGIRIFATGGLGGVHRGAELTMDVSADLTELGRTPLAVISAGCKSFLDLRKTLEFLETQGVGVATFADGRTGPVDVPGFYTRDSGVPSPKVVQDEVEAANIIHSHFALGLTSGLHFANPIPEEHSLPLPKMEAAIAEALEQARAAGASGAAETPFVLNKIKEITGSKSVVANRALVEGNVIRGTKVAVELQKLEAEGIDNESITTNRSFNPPIRQTISSLPKSSISPPVVQSKPVTLPPKANVFVAGSLAIDFACDYIPKSDSASLQPEQHTSNRARIRQSLGGVGHNVARAAHLVGASVQLCSAVGDDLSGKAATEALFASGMADTGIQTLPSQSGSRTAQYVAVNDRNKDLVLAMADMSILELNPSPRKGQPNAIDDAFESTWLPQLRASSPTHVVVDANWSHATLARWLSAAASINAHVTFEPVSTVKSTRIFSLPASAPPLPIFPTPAIHLATPNGAEVTALYHAARSAGAFDRDDWWAVIDALGLPSSGSRKALALATSNSLVDQGIPQQCLQLLPFLPSICAKLGPAGVLLTQLLAANDSRLTSAAHAPFILSRNPASPSEGEDPAQVVGGVYMRLFPAAELVPEGEVVSVNGVGDTFAGTLVAALAAATQRSGSGSEVRVEDYIDVAQQAAVLSLRSAEAVSPELRNLKLN